MSNSVIINYLIKIYTFIKEKWKYSLINNIGIKLNTLINRGLKESSMINFILSDKEHLINNSLFFRIISFIMDFVYRTAIKTGDFLKKSVKMSMIINIIINFKNKEKISLLHFSFIVSATFLVIKTIYLVFYNSMDLNILILNLFLACILFIIGFTDIKSLNFMENSKSMNILSDFLDIEG